MNHMTLKNGNKPWNTGLPKEMQPNYGKHHKVSEESKIIMSESAKKTYKEGRKVWDKGIKRECNWLKGNKAFSGRKHTKEWKEKASKRQKEFMNMPEIKEIWSEKLKNEKNPNWNGGTTKECKRRINNYKWKKLSKEILERDKNICFKCGLISIKNHIHHIIPFREVKCDNKNNLITLCGKCHAKEEKKYQRYGKTYFVEKMLDEVKKRNERI